jgi:hypothetical protein
MYGKCGTRSGLDPPPPRLAAGANLSDAIDTAQTASSICVGTPGGYRSMPFVTPEHQRSA